MSVLDMLGENRAIRQVTAVFNDIHSKIAAINSVEVINICDLYDAEGWDSLSSYDEECRKLKEWCNANDAIYYAAVREDFSVWTARANAVNAGKSKVVVEDLS